MLLSESCFDSNLLSTRSDDDNRDGSDDTKRAFLFDVAVFCLVIRIFVFMVHIVPMTSLYCFFKSNTKNHKNKYRYSNFAPHQKMLALLKCIN